MANLQIQPLWLISVLGALFALLLKLVQVGWFFQLRGIPAWAAFLEDILCVFLIIFSFTAPINGGLIAMLLFWLAVRSSGKWRNLASANRRGPLPPD
jgi:hypothetical protein